MHYLRAKKSLGQHFLVDRNIAEKIVSCLKMQDISEVLEIGPGSGILTELLLQRKDIKTTVIEIDKEYSELIKEKFPQLSDRVLNEDFLKFDINKHYSTVPVAVIGNLPYNISGRIFFRFLEYKDHIREAVVMVQKEVADRIRAVPGSKTYGILSVLVQSYYHVEYLFTVGENVFMPKPKVKSAVIRLARTPDSDPECNEASYFKVVKMAFNQRRKILRNSLKEIIRPGIEYEMLTKRPEQLSIEQFCDLTNIISRT